MAKGDEGKGPRYEQGDLFETMDAVMHGDTPIRRWKAAVCPQRPIRAPKPGCEG